ncbi:hypothetical protein ACLQ18_39725 [Streptomyces sp. DT193]|uniref:hypothetical protein n=1 Tax=Streptomyces sp. DT193 TaxID=3393418 RepID=UPI003CF4D627
MSSDRGDWWQRRAEYFLALANPEGDPPVEARELAVEVLAALMRVGLPPFNIEVAADKNTSGITLARVPGRSTVVRVAWQQDPAAEGRMLAERWQAQQAAMNQALRSILSIQEFWIEDGPLGEAPVVLGAARPPSAS